MIGKSLRYIFLHLLIPTPAPSAPAGVTQSLSIRWLLYTHYIPITGSRREGGGAGGEEERGGVGGARGEEERGGVGGAGGEEERGGWGKGRGRGGGTEETSSCMRMGDAGGEGEGGGGGLGVCPYYTGHSRGSHVSTAGMLDIVFL